MLQKVVQEVIQLCKPAKVVVITDSEEDITYIRDLAITKYQNMKI